MAGPLTIPTDRTGAPISATSDIAVLAKGGRTNLFGFVLRLLARLPFLFIAGRMYGADALGRFAYAILVIEFAAQLATLGLKRGLAERLSTAAEPPAHTIWDGLLVAGIASGAAAGLLALFPHIMFPNSPFDGREHLLPLTIFAIAWTEIALAALAYRHDVGASVRARAIVEPWTISLAALALWFITPADGLILSYALSMLAGLITAMVPMLRSYGLPHGWRPEVAPLFALARRNMPLAAADAIEWATRNIDRAILGLFFAPNVVGIYWVAQQVVTLPQKLKTSFDPILAPLLTRSLRNGDHAGMARHVRQVGFWILAAQAGIALALSISGEAVMGLVGPAFVAGAPALVILMLAEVAAATAAVSETALVYVARHRNLMISLGVIALQISLSFGFVLGARDLGLPLMWQASGPALGLFAALTFGAIAKSRLLSQLLGAPVSGWRRALVGASAAALLIGGGATLIPEWGELMLGIPAALAAYAWVIWRTGFTPEDRILFKRTR